MAFISRIIPNYTRPTQFERAIIFNQWDAKKAGPMIAIATLRHGWMIMYKHFTRVETNAESFTHHKTYLQTLLSIRDAALRKGRELAIAHTHNVCSAAEPHSPKGYHAELAEQISPLVTIGSDWTTKPTTQLQDEIRLAETALQSHLNKT